jgi:uncharacterized protein
VIQAGMDAIFSLLTPAQFALACGIAFLAGWIKGMVGFAMPMIMISGLSMFLAPELALVGLILATVVTNGQQALREGFDAAWGATRKFRVFLLVGLLFLMSSAQLVRFLEPSAFLLLLGVPVSVFAIVQLMGLRLVLQERSLKIEAGVGAFAGFIGGLSGVWGPPTVLYLTALNTPKGEQMRVQGVIYGLGAVALLIAHFGSGVMRAETWPLSAALVPPAVVGMWLGGRLQDSIDQTTFRKLTLLVLTIAGLNLVRRGLMG